MLFNLHFCTNINTSLFIVLQDGDTALIAAARIGHASTCTALIERGAHVDCQDNVSVHGKTS